MLIFWGAKIHVVTTWRREYDRFGEGVEVGEVCCGVGCYILCADALVYCEPVYLTASYIQSYTAVRFHTPSIVHLNQVMV